MKRTPSRPTWALGAVLSTVVLAALVFAVPALTAGGAYTLGDLSLQNGWDGGAGGGGFTNNNPNSNVVTNTDAHTGTQSWRYSGSYNSPGAGTPFTPNVATVGALNATAAGSPITPAGNKSVVSFAFKAVVPGDGSKINVYEGSNSRDDRTGASLYLGNNTDNGNPVGTISLYNFASANDSPDCNTPQVNLGNVSAGAWHTVEMTTTYPNLVVSDPSTYGSTTYVVDKGTGSQQTFTMQSWAHAWRHCNGFNYSPGGSLKWSNSFNDYPTHQGFYIDDLSMVVTNTVSNTTVGSFSTSFEATVAPTVRSNKQSALAALQSLTPTGNKANDKRVATAISRINSSLTPSRWIDDNHVVIAQGEGVFADEKEAVQQLFGYPGPRPAAVNAALTNLLDADQLLAQTLINDKTGGNAKKLADANKEMTKAAQDRSGNNLPGAMGHYKNAWKLASQA